MNPTDVQREQVTCRDNTLLQTSFTFQSVVDNDALPVRKRVTGPWRAVGIHVEF